MRMPSGKPHRSALTRGTERFALCSFIALAAAGCASRPQVSLRLAEVGRLHRLAIYDFTDAPGADTGHSGGVVAGIVGERALKVKGWSLVERQKLKKVFDELDLQSTGDFDRATAVRAGKLMGADGIVVGEVVQYRIGSIPFFFFFAFDQDVYKVDFSFRLISVQTNEVCLSAHVSTQSVVSFQRAISDGVEQVFGEIERQLNPPTGGS